MKGVVGVLHGTKIGMKPGRTYSAEEFRKLLKSAEKRKSA